MVYVHQDYTIYIYYNDIIDALRLHQRVDIICVS